MTDLAETVKITRSRLTYAVTRLERDGLVRREDCRWDRRSSIAVLTDEGMAALERAAPGHVETVRSTLFDRLTPAQVGQLEEIFTSVARGLQDEDAEAGTGDVPWRRRSSCSSSQPPSASS
jgi:DNA-binding MarR family transcriptional regulator